MTRRSAGILVVAAALVLAGCAAAPAPSPEEPVSAASTPPATPDPTAARAACDPVRVTVPSLGIDEEIIAQGLDAKGQLNPEPKQTVWYTGSPRPGDDGVAVIAGHVQNVVPDVFWELDRVKPGDAIDVRCADGRVVALSVTRTKSVDKVALQSDATVWGPSPTPVVAIITCDRNSRVVARHHVNNFVVWAAPRN